MMLCIIIAILWYHSQAKAQIPNDDVCMAVRICCLTPHGRKTSPRTQLLMAQDPQADGKRLFWQQTTHFVHEKQQHSYCHRLK